MRNTDAYAQSEFDDLWLGTGGYSMAVNMLTRVCEGEARRNGRRIVGKPAQVRTWPSRNILRTNMVVSYRTAPLVLTHASQIGISR